LRFTVHRPASAEVSPCCHRPPGGDVACSVHISIARLRTTGDALENRLALAIFRRDMPAVAASLRGVGRWDKFEAPHSFVLQPGHQQSPPLAADRTVEAPFLCDVGAQAFARTASRLGHGPHLQVLDADGLEPTRQIGGGLFHPVTPTIGFTRPQPGHGQPCSFSPRRLWAWRDEAGGHYRWADRLGAALVACGPDALYPAIQCGSEVVQ
jgi:hypothetical protein